MSILHTARKSMVQPSGWLRVVLVGLLLAFAVDVIAHVVHRHDDTVKTSLTTHGPACGSCAAFDSLIDAPKQSYSAINATAFVAYVAPAADLPASFQPNVTAQPRAPPR